MMLLSREKRSYQLNLHFYLTKTLTMTENTSAIDFKHGRLFPALFKAIDLFSLLSNFTYSKTKTGIHCFEFCY